MTLTNVVRQVYIANDARFDEERFVIAASLH